MTLIEAIKNLGYNMAYALWIVVGFALATAFPITYMCLFAGYALQHAFVPVEVDKTKVSRLLFKLRNFSKFLHFIVKHLIHEPVLKLRERSENVIPSLLHVAIIAAVFYFFGVPTIVQTAFSLIGFPNLLTAMGSNLFLIAQHTQNFVETAFYLGSSAIDTVLSVFGYSVFSAVIPKYTPITNFASFREKTPTSCGDFHQSINWHNRLNIITVPAQIGEAAESVYERFLNFRSGSA